MKARFNFICNILILGFFLAYGTYKLWEYIWEWKKDKEYNEAIAQQNKWMKEEWKKRYDETDVYICFLKSVSAQYIGNAPRGITRRYEILYPIKGALEPGDFLNTHVGLECIANGAYVDFWKAVGTHSGPYIFIVFVDPGIMEEKGKIKKHPCTRNLSDSFILSMPLDRENEECSLFLDVLKEIGWDKEIRYPLSVR